MVAASSDSLGSIKLLIKFGAKINQVNKDGISAYLAAAGSGNSGDARYLVNHGANPCVKNKQGQDGSTLALAWGNHSAAMHLRALQKKCSHNWGERS